MRAIILAGGLGTRLLPYTTLIPKPLVPIGNKYSILEIILMQLAQHKFTHVTITVNHLSHLIESYFGDGERFGLNIDYSLETKPLSTIAPLTLIKDLPDNFLVMNGDILTDLNFSHFYEAHCKKKARATVASFSRVVKSEFGVLEYNDQKQLIGFQEKPTLKFDVSMGIYCFNKSVIENIQVDEPYGFDNLMHDSLKNKSPVDISPFNGYWLDIGRSEDYQYANENFESLLQKLGLNL